MEVLAILYICIVIPIVCLTTLYMRIGTAANVKTSRLVPCTVDWYP